MRGEASSQANNVRYEEETAALPYSKWLDVLNRLAERLEGALVGSEVPGMTTDLTTEAWGLIRDEHERLAGLLVFAIDVVDDHQTRDTASMS